MKMNPFIGRQILEVVTAGMYSEPQMVLREYIQNAADSIDQAEAAGLMKLNDGLIDISIDGKKRSIKIEDNGTGLSNYEAQEYLCSLGWSSKHNNSARGFRGIGRLGGLGYCRVVEFETRSNGNEDVAVVTWDGEKLRSMHVGSGRKQGLSNAIEHICDLKFRSPSNNDPTHFFRIRLIDVQSFHKDDLMDVKGVRNYLSQVAPVSYNSNFDHASKVNTHLSQIEGFRTYRIMVNGKEVTRPYENIVAHNKDNYDQIYEVELFDFNDDEGEILAKGWFAIMEYKAAIPAHLNLRGIRIRQGNIQIGSEKILDKAFSEDRFAYWHIGEIIVSNGLQTNARRDGFEQSVKYEKFLEQTYMLGQYLSSQCRHSSKKRGAIVRAERNIEIIEKLLYQNIFVDEEHLERSLSRIDGLLQAVEKISSDYNLNGLFERRIELIRTSLEQRSSQFCGLQKQLDGRALKYLSKKELLENISRCVLQDYDESESAGELLRKLLDPYLTPDRKSKNTEHRAL